MGADMAMSYSEFLYKYFQQLHLNSMSDVQKARLKDLRGDPLDVPVVDPDNSPNIININPRARPFDVRSGAQKGWKMDETTGNFDPVPDMDALVSIGDLTDAEVIKLYRKIQETLRAMDKDNERIKQDVHPKLPDKWAPFFGDSKLKPFYEFRPNIDENILDELINLVEGTTELSTGEHISNYIKFNCFAKEEDYSPTDFINDGRTRNYNAKFINKLDMILYKIGNEYPVTSGRPKADVSDFWDGGRFSALRGGLEPSDSNDPINTDNFNMFKRPQVYNQILGLLYSDDKFKEQFANYGGGTITAQLDRVKKNIDYSNVAPKMADKKSILNKVKELLDETIDGTFAKLFDRHKRHNYLTHAKGMMNAIVKAGLNPNEGLEKILAKDKDIQEEILKSSPASMDGWKIFMQTLTEIKTGMPDAFKGCLKRGYQMRAVVEQVIARCVEMTPPKFEEAKAVLETLSVLRYGNLSSDKWDEWKKNDLKPFDKVAGMDKGFFKWFATGTTVALNLGVNSLFWACQIGANIWHRRGTKFGNKKGKALGALEQPLKEYNYNNIAPPPYEANKIDPDHVNTYLKEFEAAEVAMQAAWMAFRANQNDAALEAAYNKTVERYNAAWKNLENKWVREEDRKEDAVKKGQAHSVAEMPEEKRKYDMILDLMAFWDWQTSIRASDYNPFRSHKRHQERVTREMAVYPTDNQLTNYMQQQHEQRTA
jgi:hypothetical protein